MGANIGLRWPARPAGRTALDSCLRNKPRSTQRSLLRRPPPCICSHRHQSAWRSHGQEEGESGQDSGAQATEGPKTRRRSPQTPRELRPGQRSSCNDSRSKRRHQPALKKSDAGHTNRLPSGPGSPRHATHAVLHPGQPHSPHRRGRPSLRALEGDEGSMCADRAETQPRNGEEGHGLRRSLPCSHSADTMGNSKRNPLCGGEQSHSCTSSRASLEQQT